ncbi:MAG: hypothetical protein QXY15_10725 [Candidatus Nitrosotenuis sp.]
MGFAVDTKKLYIFDTTQNQWHLIAQSLGSGGSGGSDSQITVQKDGQFVGQRPVINLISGVNTILIVSDDEPSQRVNVSVSVPYASSDVAGVIRLTNHLSGSFDQPTIVDGVSVQKVRVQHNGNTVGTRPTINFVSGTNISLLTNDDSSNNRVVVVINSLDEKVKTTYVDTAPSYLIDKIDGSIIVNHATQKIQLSGDLTGPPNYTCYSTNEIGQKGWFYPKIHVFKDGNFVGVRKSINFLGDFIVSDNDATDSIDVSVYDILVKADISDPNAGFLSDKVDNNTLAVDTEHHYIYVKPNSVVQKTEIAKDGSIVGIRKQINFITGNNINLNIQDNNSSDRVDVNISVPDASTTNKGVVRLSGHLGGSADYPIVIDDTSNQRISIQNNGTHVGSRKTINFVPTTNITHVIVEDNVNNRINVQSHVVDDSSIQKIEIAKDGNLVGTRKRINFITGTNQTLTVSDDNANNRVNVKIDIPDASSSTRGVVKLSGHLGGTSDSPVVLDDTSNQRVNVLHAGTNIGTRKTLNFINTSTVTYNISDDTTNNRINIQSNVVSDSSVQKVEVSKDGTVVGTRKTINYQTGNNQTLIVSDDTTNNRVNVRIDIPDASTTTKGVLQLAGHLGGSATSPIVIDDTSNQKVRISRDGTLVGTRRQINFVTGTNQTLTVSDDSTNNRIDVQIDVPNASNTVRGALRLSGHLSGTADSPTVVDDTSNQRVSIQSNGTSVGTRRAINFIAGTGISYTISDDTTNNRVNIQSSVVADSVVQKIEVSKDGTLVGTRKRVNFQTGTNQTLTVSDDNTNNRVNVRLDVPNATDTTRGVIRLSGHLSGTADSPTVVDDTSNQRVGVQNNGTLIGTRKTINFIPGSNVSFAISDDSLNNRINVTISSSGGVTTDEKVKADSGDPTAGYLSDKVDNSTVKVDTTNHRLYVPSDSSTQKVEISKDGVLVGTRKRINFQTGTNQTLSVIDDTTNNQVNVKIDVPDATASSKGVIQLAGHLSGSASSPTVVDDTSNQRVNVQQNSVSRGTRRSINFVDSGQITYNITDNIANNRVDIQSSIVNDSSVQKVESASNGTLVSTRKRLNFVNSSSVNVSVSDDASNNRTNISYTVADDSSVQKTEFSKDGTLVGIRKRLNIVSHNTTDVTLTDNNTNNRVDMTIATKLDNYGSLTYTTSGIKLKDDENAAAYYCYTVPGSGGSTRKWQPIPLSTDTGIVTLNITMDLQSTETIIDGGAGNPIFQLVLLPGKWFIMVHLEGHIRGNTGSSSGSYQNIIAVYLRTGVPPTDTLLQNIRLNFVSQNANITQGFSMFNSINKTFIITTTYDGTTTDIRGNTVTGTVLYLRGRYTTSGSASVTLSQLFSTCTLQGAQIHQL